MKKFHPDKEEETYSLLKKYKIVPFFEITIKMPRFFLVTEPDGELSSLIPFKLDAAIYLVNKNRYELKP